MSLTRLVLILSALLLTSVSTAASTRTYELVHPRVCLAGHWGKPVKEWRVQLGVFQDERNAVELERVLAGRGVRAEHYIAVWLAGGDEEPMAVVSQRVFKSQRTALGAAKKLRRAGFRAFPRYYTRYRR